MNRDDVTHLQHRVEEAALRADELRNDAAGLERLVNEVALRAGVPIAEVVTWSVERLQQYVADMQVHLVAELRASLRQAISLDRITTLTEAAGMPADMTVDEGVEQGIITAEEITMAHEVTEADIDTVIAEIEAGHEVTEADIDTVIAEGDAT